MIARETSKASTDFKTGDPSSCILLFFIQASQEIKLIALLTVGNGQGFDHESSK